ncbi:MAG: tRNA (adenosine(37)-N6)-threonylcarbamoyltransferase complex dimerization subunit type 1 TsaB, partial [Planctomycetes bacterium]|nr:tRNA (adenosine(37)-N6)-threonylcarbamoyltransferase complex dimerization subunit type 1 TsaB [Planctomycetota bacterium]
MRVLVIETATANGAMALLGAGLHPVRRSFPQGLSHGRHLVPEIERGLAEAGVRPQEIELIAVDRGPGSYTGIRVGVTAAKCLAWALGIPVVGVGALEVLARGTPRGQGWVAPVVDAHRREVYGALFDRADPPREGFDAFVGPPVELARRLPPDALLFGDGPERYPDVFERFSRGPAAWSA